MTFEKVPSQPLSTFNVIVCFSYGSYSNLADLCDSATPITINTNGDEETAEVISGVLGDLVRQAPISDNFESIYNVTLGKKAIKSINFANPLAVSI